jgi:hypothetical protein
MTSIGTRTKSGQIRKPSYNQKYPGSRTAKMTKWLARIAQPIVEEAMKEIYARTTKFGWRNTRRSRKS